MLFAATDKLFISKTFKMTKKLKERERERELISSWEYMGEIIRVSKFSSFLNHANQEILLNNNKFKSIFHFIINHKTMFV